ncbi:hypothetical protein [Roseivirga sp. E12]|uniref:hypothetical protein n=1 Tax=Roseivirga sp. E12 TaxID=2819237 RepID=UPI001ABC7E4F|nr:hypothetical protein [Roseivirga sp. E12]MBO3697210.1 hypothetical protein [Roseivirga sp. E12]
MRSWLIAFSIILINTVDTVDSSAWNLSKEDDGISVYTKTDSKSGLKVFRGVTKVETSLSNLVALMKSIEDGPNWIYNCTEAKVLSADNFWEEYIYFRNHVRWPFRDRDAVVHMKLDQDPLTGILTISMKGVPDYIPETKKVVRMPVMEGYWQLAPVGDHVIVTYQMMSDPGKGIPDFLIRISLIDYPFETLSKLRDRVNLPKYQNLTFPELSLPKE